MMRTWYALLFAACAHQASTQAAAPAPQPTNAPRSRVWAAALSVLADRAIPIKTVDERSGLIATDEVSIPAADTKQAGECVKRITGTARPSRAQYTILVAGDSAATVRVSARLTWWNVDGSLLGECASTGVLEGRLTQAIVSRAK